MLPALSKSFLELEALRKQTCELVHSGGVAVTKRPAPNDWSLTEVIEHLILVERGIVTVFGNSPAKRLHRRSLAQRLRRAAVGVVLLLGIRVKVPVEAIRPLGHTALADLEAEWIELRRHLAEHLEQITPEKLGLIILKHPVSGPHNVPETLSFLERHLRHHRRQIQRIITQLSGIGI